ncbi:MAG TPA: hypothetical protein VM265_08000 [Sphingomicrobium sp.]|nr:hypothetical protein [Sphingomicrobium sp.]
MSADKRKLLRLIAALPPGEKLPIGRMAREIAATQSVAVALVQAMIAEGSLDPDTLRPPASEGRAVPGARSAAALTCDELHARLCAEADRRGVSRTAASKAIFGHASQLASLKGRSDRAPMAKTIRKAEAWLGDRIEMLERGDHARPGAGAEEATKDSSSGGPEAGGSAVSGPSSSRCDAVAPAAFDRGPSGSLVRVTSEQLLAEIDAFIAANPGLNRYRFSVALNATSGAVQMIGRAKFPKPETVEKVRTLIARGIAAPPAGAAAPITRDRRAAAGLPPSMRQVREEHSIDLCAANRERIEREQKRAEEARRTRRPGQSLAARILELGREVDAEMKAEQAAERERKLERELDELVNPSSLLKRAQRDWPDQSAKVRALAGEMGVALGEAWHRVIGAGIDALAKGGA